MKVITPSDIASLEVRKSYRCRPTDSDSWWLAITHTLPDECLVTTSVLLDLESRWSNDVDVLINRDQGADGPVVYGEIVVWLEPKVAP